MRTRTNIVISCGVGAAILLIIALRGPVREPAPPIGAERVPPGEARHTAHIIERLKQQLSAGGATTLRDTLPRQLGCVRAEFAVIDNLAPELAVGIFQPGARYAAWVRFSNDADRQSDRNPDVRGMAIKLLGVRGETLHGAGPENATHDLLFVSHPVFPFADVATYAQAFEAPASDKTPRFLFKPSDTGLNSLHAVRGRRAGYTELLDTRWWSVLPYRYGEGRAVKYSARPCNTDAAESVTSANNGQQAQLKQRLANGAGCFEFMLQFQNDAERMPIEDPSVEWDEVLSPFEPVALLTIPPQRVDSNAQMQLCENLSFNPWQALPAHRPLGGINRARREIYAAIAELRRDRD